MVATKPLLKVGTVLLLTVPIAMGLRDSVVGARRAALAEAGSPSHRNWAQFQKQWRGSRVKRDRIPA